MAKCVRSNPSSTSHFVKPRPVLPIVQTRAVVRTDAEGVAAPVPRGRRVQRINNALRMAQTLAPESATAPSLTGPTASVMRTALLQKTAVTTYATYAPRSSPLYAKRSGVRVPPRTPWDPCPLKRPKTQREPRLTTASPTTPAPKKTWDWDSCRTITCGPSPRPQPISTW